MNEKRPEPLRQGYLSFGMRWVDLCLTCGKPAKGHHHLPDDIAAAIAKGRERVEPMPAGENMSLKDLAVYAGLSERTLRSLIAAPVNPIPHHRVGRRVLVKRSDYDVWAAQYRKVGVDFEEKIAKLKTRRRKAAPASRRAT
jgi:excisionase family DNA binding protein